VLVGAAGSASAEDLPRPPGQAASQDDGGRIFSPDDLLWLEVRAGGVQIAESLDAYSSRAGVYVPLGGLADVLELAVTVLPPEQRAEGWIIAPDRKFDLDLKRGTATVGAQTVKLAEGDAVMFGGDIFLRVEFAERLLPLSAKVDIGAQLLQITPREALPYQQRAVRSQRRGRLVGRGYESVLRVPTPYRLLSMPSFDFNSQQTFGVGPGARTRRYDVRAAGDVARGGLQVFAGSDGQGRLQDLRVNLERKDPDGRRAGPFGAKRASLGDVYAPGLTLGPNAAGGRGVYLSSASPDQGSLFAQHDLRGELPLGFEVELYVNEVLQGSQSTATQGLYEFLDVPLAYGLNTLRLVFYGPRGEVHEEVRRINFGAGQAPRGEMIFHLAAMEAGRDLFDIRDDPAERALLSRPRDLRLVGAIDYGLTDVLTLSAGVARFTPLGRTDARTTGSLGLRTSLLGVAAQADLAADDQGGGAFALGLAGRRLGASFYARHAEFVRNFIDEVQSPRALGHPVTRATNLRMDAMAPIGRGFAAPLAVNFRREQFQAGGTALRADARVSAPLDNMVASSSWTYRDENTLTNRTRTVLGDLDIASLWSSAWQLRASLNYEVKPDPRLLAASTAVDIGLTDRAALRLSATRRMGQELGTLFQATATRQMAVANLGLTAGYDTRDAAWTAGLQLAFGAMYNPLRSRYQLSRPGVTTGGSVALQAFVDANNDNQMQADEEPVAGVQFAGGMRRAVTGRDGGLMVTGLGDGGYARAKISTDDLDDPFLTASSGTIEHLPRPGNVARVLYPLKPTSSLALTIKFNGPGQEPPLGLSALSVLLVDESGETVARGRTEFDGRLVLENVPSGYYKLTLEPGQAQRLGVELEFPVVLDVPRKGGFIEGPVAYVRPVVLRAAL
jgi:hypothetical protein